LMSREVVVTMKHEKREWRSTTREMFTTWFRCVSFANVIWLKTRCAREELCFPKMENSWEFSAKENSVTATTMPYVPPADRSMQVFSILQQRLPSEIVYEILNLAQLYRRETCARRLQSVRSSCGLSKASREEKRQVYLDVQIKTVRRVRKITWSIRMPDVHHFYSPPSAHKCASRFGNQFSPLEVSLYRPSQHSSPNRCQTSSEIVRSPLSFAIPQSTQTKYLATWPSSHDFVKLIRRGDRVKLILPAVFGDGKSRMGYHVSPGEIWEAVVCVFTEW
jgi:hypothetical protein